MEYYPFPAILRSSYNNVHEYGQASITAKENAVDFTSEFIPLLPLGACAEISWVLGERTLAMFRGSVYLSSKNLLRIVDVNPNELKKARTVLAINTNLPATIIMPAKESMFISSKLPKHSAEILFLSKNTIKIKTDEYASAGQKIFLNAEVDFLTLANLPLIVKERLLIKRGEALLICEVVPSSDDNTIALSSYSARLEKQSS